MLFFTCNTLTKVRHHQSQKAVGRHVTLKQSKLTWKKSLKDLTCSKESSDAGDVSSSSASREYQITST